MREERAADRWTGALGCGGSVFQTTFQLGSYAAAVSMAGNKLLIILPSASSRGFTLPTIRVNRGHKPLADAAVRQGAHIRPDHWSHRAWLAPGLC